jgi:hypothetical protein
VIFLKITKNIGLLVLIIQIVSFVAFGLSVHSIYEILSSTFSEGLTFELDIGETKETGILQVEVTPQNKGYLDADVSLGLSLLDQEGRTIASEFSSINISPGTMETIYLRLEISLDDYEKILSEEMSFLELHVGMRTLYNLVGVSDTITIPQEVQQ